MFPGSPDALSLLHLQYLCSRILFGQVKQGAATVWGPVCQCRAFGPEMGAAPSTGLKSRQGAAAGEHFPQGL